MSDLDKTVEVPLPPSPPANKSKIVTWVAVAIVVVGAILEAMVQVGGMFPDASWVGKVTMLGGIALKSLHALLAFLNAGAVDLLAEKKAKELSAKDAANKLGKP